MRAVTHSARAPHHLGPRPLVARSHSPLQLLRAIASVVALATACSDPLPTVETVAGTYAATVFVVQEGQAEPVDLLAEGGFITITLTVAGTTSGQVFGPGGGEGGEDFEADLTGTWMLEGSIVTFDHPADTFLRDMEFRVEEDRLFGEASFGAKLTVELTRQ